MAITYVGGTTGYGESSPYDISLTTLTGGTDSSPSTGDIVVINWGVYRGSNQTMTVNTSGYTQVADLYANDTTDTNLGCAYKIMGATPDTVVNVNGSGAATGGANAVIQVWRGVDVTTPMDATPTTATGVNTTYSQNPSITPVTSGAVIIIAAGNGTNSSLTVSTTPSGYSNMLEISYDPGYVSTNYIASKYWVSGTENPANWVMSATSTTSAWCAITMALRPAVFGPANLKTYNTNVKANIKSINTNLIANCKSLNTNV